MGNTQYWQPLFAVPSPVGAYPIEMSAVYFARATYWCKLLICID